MWREWDLCLDSYFCMRMSNHSSNTCKDCNTVLILHPCQRSVDCIHRGLFLNCYVPFISLSVFCHYHTILIMVALYYILKSESISPPTLFFFNTVLVILFFFFFFFLSISLKSLCPYPQNTLLGCYIVFIHQVGKNWHIDSIHTENIFWFV